MSELPSPPRLAVVLPCYRSAHKVADVINRMPPCVSKIIAVNDCSPDDMKQTLKSLNEPRLHVLTNDKNVGVGGATKVGWDYALDQGFDLIAKLDSDGQMPPHLLEDMSKLMQQTHADAVKGNRFFRPSQLTKMPRKRLYGNSILSLICKLSSGYWSMSDPNNGLLMIKRETLERLPLDKVHDRYFFESDMLFRLGLDRAKLVELPMDTVYANETSSLNALRSIPLFASRHVRNFVKRFYYRYMLADFGLATLNTLTAIPLMIFGLSFGLHRWLTSSFTGEPATAGQVMIAALPIIIATQMISMAVAYDIANEPGK